MTTQKTSQLYADILNRLSQVRRKEHRIALTAGLLSVLPTTLMIIFFVVLLEQVFSFGTTGRGILLVIAVMGIFNAFGWFIIRPLLYVFNILRSSDIYMLARKVGNHFPLVRDRLLDAIQMYEAKAKLAEHYSLQLIDASFNDLAKQIQPLNFSDAVSDFGIRWKKKLALFIVGALFLIIIISPSGFYGSFYRITHYHQTFSSQTAVYFFVQPGNVEVVRGDNVFITIHANVLSSKTLTLFIRQQGQINFDIRTLVASSNGMFSSKIENIKSSTEYFASINEIKSEKFTITVMDRPLIRSFQLKIIPPPYTQLSIKLLDENLGDINAYSGSKVDLQLKASKELDSVSMVFSDNTLLQLSCSGNEARTIFPVKKNLSYHFRMKDLNGLANIDPVEYEIKIIPDEYPTVEIVSPGKNIDLAGEMKLDLLLRIKDDFGFSKAQIAYRLVQSRYEPPAENITLLSVPLTQLNQSQADAGYHWDLSSLNLVPEDVVAYYAEVFDNDAVAGPKAARSQMFILRLPSLEEVFSDVSQTHRESIESLQNIAKETEQLKKEIDDFQRDIKKSRDKMDWQQQNKSEQMTQRYDALKKKLDETTQTLNEMMKKMDENKLLSNETMEKYTELQKMMEKLNSPELRDALKKMQESMKQLSPEQMKQAMEQLKLTEEQFRQSLERTLELLKRIHIEQKLDELIKRTEELMKQQESLKQQAASANTSNKQELDELVKKQLDLQKQLESLQKETSALKEKMEEFPGEMPLDEMREAEQQLQQNQLSRKMQSSASQMQNGNMLGAQKNQQETDENLKDFKKQLEKAQKSLLDKQMKQIVNEMRKELEDILELSKREESLKEETKNLDPNSQRFRNNIQRQNEVMNDITRIANAMGELSKKTFAISPEMGKELGNALRQMSEAMQQMEYRNPAGSSQKQGEAMGSLNRSAMMMQGTLSNMMQGGGTGMGMAGLMAQLQQMANNQGGINQGTQQTMGMGGGQGKILTAQQQAEYQRLGAQQGTARKSLEQLAQEAKNAGEYSRLLGDLDRIAQDMKEVQSDLQQGSVNPNTLAKQERILSRLLESTRSMRERDYEKRRRAESGQDIFKASPSEIDLTTQEGRDRYREELLKAVEGKYAKDYEELIKKYFEELEREAINR